MQRLQILQNILEQTSSNAPDARLLLDYSIDDQAYAAIQATLSQNNSPQAFAQIAHLDALFVLFATQWWARKYDGGQWIWSDIFEAVSLPLPKNAADRNKIIEDGLRFWGHSIEGTGKKFFRAIINQSAVPLYYGRHAKTHTLLTRTLRLALRLGWSREAIQLHMFNASSAAEFGCDAEVFEHLLSGLSKTVADMVETHAKVMAMRHSGQPAEATKILTDGRARWAGSTSSLRKAEKLILELEAILHEVDTPRAGPTFRAERYLRQASPGGPWSIHSRIHVKERVASIELVRYFGLSDVSEEAEALPYYFAVDCFHSGEPRLADGRRDHARADFVQLTARHSESHGVGACSQHALVLRGPSGNPTSLPVNVTGGHEIFLYEPLVFGARDGHLRLLNMGTGRFRDAEVHVIFDGSLWEAEAISGDNSHFEELPEFAEVGKDAYCHALLRGAVKLRSKTGLDDVHLASGCGDSLLTSDQSFQWHGPQLGFSPANANIYTHTPRLFTHNSDDTVVEIPTDEIFARPQGASTPLALLSSCSGALDVYWMRNGQPGAKFRFAILRADPARPAGALHFGSLPKNRLRSTIAVKGRDVKSAEAINLGPGVRAAQGAHGEIVFDLEPQCDVPALVEIEIQWSPQVDKRTRIKVPFPKMGGAFYDGEGKPIRSGARLTIPQLTGTRLHLFDQNPGSRNQFYLRLSLPQPADAMASDINSTLTEVFDITLRGGTHHEIKLIDFLASIEGMLSIAGSLDASLTISLQENARETSHFLVSRYESELQYLDGVGVKLTDDIGGGSSSDLNEVEIFAAPIRLPDVEQVHLEPSFDQEGALFWRCTGILEDSQGPWLLFPATTSRIQFRPTAWNAPLCDQEGGMTPLSIAMGTKETRGRWQALEEEVIKMEQEWNRVSWMELSSLLDTFGHLPLSCLDIVRLVGGRPLAASILLLKTDGDQREIDIFATRLRNELGVFWETVPLTVWRFAIGMGYRHYLSLGGEEVARLLLDAKLAKIRGALPALRVHFDMLRFELIHTLDVHIRDSEFIKLNPSSGRAGAKIALSPSLEELRNSLLLIPRSGQRWPEKHVSCAFETEQRDQLIQLATGAVPKESQGKLIAVLDELMFKPSGDFKAPICNAPILLAIHGILFPSLLPDGWLHERNTQHQLIIFRTFAPQWFDAAVKEAFSACVRAGLVAPIFAR